MTTLKRKLYLKLATICICMLLIYGLTGEYLLDRKPTGKNMEKNENLNEKRFDELIDEIIKNPKFLMNYKKEDGLFLDHNNNSSDESRTSRYVANVSGNLDDTGKIQTTEDFVAIIINNQKKVTSYKRTWSADCPYPSNVDKKLEFQPWLRN